jgi:hypothetical protein
LTVVGLGRVVLAVAVHVVGMIVVGGGGMIMSKVSLGQARKSRALQTRARQHRHRAAKQKKSFTKSCGGRLR